MANPTPTVARATAPAQTNNPTPEQFLQKTLKQSAIAPDIARKRGYQAVTHEQWKELGKPEGIPDYQWGPGLWMPLFPPMTPMNGNGTQDKPYPQGMIRLMQPKQDKKYFVGTGTQQILDVLHYKTNPTPKKPLYIIEGVKQADAVASLHPDMSIVAIQGCWGWAKPDTKGQEIRPALIALAKERPLRILLDGDLRTNKNVRTAAQRCIRAFRQTAATETPRLVLFPFDPEQPTAGIDDYLADGGDWSMIQEVGTLPKTNSPRSQKSREASSTLKKLLADTKLSDATLAAYLLESTPLQHTVRVLPSGQVYAFGENKLWKPLSGTKKNGIIGWFITQHLPDFVREHFAPAIEQAKKNKDKDGADEIEQAQAEQLKLLGQHTRRMAIAAEVYQRADLDATPNDLIGQDHLLPMPDGKVWDLRAFDLDKPIEEYERDRQPEDNFTWAMPCTPKPGTLDVFDQAIRSRLGTEATEALIDTMGYVMQGQRTEERAILFRGIGRQGKSLIANQILGERILGDGWTECAKDYFFGRKDRHDHHLLNHMGKRLITVTDPAGRMRETEFLSYTGGGLVQAEKKGGDTISFKATACLLINGQDERLRIDGADIAIRERLWTLTFPPVPANERDTQLLRKLIPEIPALAYEAVARAAYYVQDGILSNVEFLTTSTTTLANEHNPIAQFVEERCILDPAGWTPSALLFQAWQEWCLANNVIEGNKSSNWFGKSLCKTYEGLESKPGRYQGAPKRGMVGIRLASPDEEEGEV